VETVSALPKSRLMCAFKKYVMAQNTHLFGRYWKMRISVPMYIAVIKNTINRTVVYIFSKYRSIRIFFNVTLKNPLKIWPHLDRNDRKLTWNNFENQSSYVWLRYGRQFGVLFFDSMYNMKTCSVAVFWRIGSSASLVMLCSMRLSFNRRSLAANHWQVTRG